MEKKYEIIPEVELMTKLQLWHQGKWQPRKLYTDHQDIDELLSPMLGSCLDITGYPSHGKTLFAEELAVSWLSLYDYKHFAYIPDAGSDMQVAASYIHRMSGNTIEPKHKNQISEKEMLHLLAKFNSNFKMVRRAKGQDLLTPVDFYHAVRDNGCQIGWVDSFNHLNNGDNSPTSIRHSLSIRNEIAEANEILFCQIVHPRNPTPSEYMDIEKNLNGEIKKVRMLIAPTQYNLMGGSEWNNFAKTIIVVYKETFFQGRHQVASSPIFEVQTLKVKNNIEGQKGVIELFHDWEKKAFYTNFEGVKKYTLNRYQGHTMKPEDIKPNQEFLNQKKYGAINPDDEPF